MSDLRVGVEREIEWLREKAHHHLTADNNQAGRKHRAVAYTTAADHLEALLSDEEPQERCPTCESDGPNPIHVSPEGQEQNCPDPFHSQPNPQQQGEG